MEMNPSFVLHDNMCDLNCEIKYEIDDLQGNVLVSGIARQGNQYLNKYWRYVVCEEFKVPSQLPRDKDLHIKITVSNDLWIFLHKMPCTQFVILKGWDK